MEHAKPATTTGDKLGQSDDPGDPVNQPLDPARHKLYRTAVGKLLWATPVRPDISFAVKELSRSLQSPTLQNEKQLKHVLRYLKGSLQYTTCLQPPRKRVVEQASTIEIQFKLMQTPTGQAVPRHVSQPVVPACACGE